MLCPSEDVTKFEAADEARFRTQLWALVAETHERWPTERFWRSPQGRICRDFDGHPILGKYLRSANFDPRVVVSPNSPSPLLIVSCGPPVGFR